MTSVAIMDAERAFQQHIQNILQATEQLQCYGCYTHVDQLAGALSQRLPDVLLLGVCTEQVDCLAQLRELRARWPQLRIILLAAQCSDDRVIESLRLGAGGFLLRQGLAEKLPAAIRELQYGGVPLSRSIARGIVSYLSAEQTITNQLSGRERMVYQLLCKGLNYREMAERLFVSPNTIRFHLKNIYRKLGVKSRHEAASLAFQSRSG